MEYTFKYVFQFQRIDKTKDQEPDELQLPSPPQRRLSRSSIDLRDLELQSHEKVPHTDSAPSIIITDHFTFDDKHHCGKSTNSLQHLLKDELLLQPLATTSTPVHHQLLPSTKRTDLEILRDNDQLARFIEDNFCYYKKQNSTPADELRRNVNGHGGNLNMVAMSESDFDYYRRQTVSAAATEDKSNIKQDADHPRSTHLSACSDSDFMVTAGKRRQRSRVLSSVKSPIGYAKNMFAGRGGSSNAAASSQPDEPPNNTRPLQSTHRENRAMLSRSCNECYDDKSAAASSTEVTNDVRALQRVLSEGGANTKITNETSAARRLAMQQQQWTTVDMFLQMICDSNKNKADISTSPPLAPLPKRDNTCSDQLLLLNVNANCGELKVNSLNDFTVLSGTSSTNNHNSSAPSTAKFYEHISKSDQQVIVNMCATDDPSPHHNGANYLAGNLRDNRTKSEHIFVNSVVVNASAAPKSAIFTFSPDDPPYAVCPPSAAAVFSTNIPTVALVPPISPINLLSSSDGGRINNNHSSLVIPNEHAREKAPNGNNGNNGGNGNLLRKEKNRGGAAGHISVVTYAVSVAGSASEIEGGDGVANDSGYGGRQQLHAISHDQRGRPSTSSTSK